MFQEMVLAPMDLIINAGWSQVLIAMVGGLAFGAFLGAMPGITGVIAVALMFPPSIYMNPVVGVVLLSAVYTGSVYGGGVMSIALNIPGTGAAVAATFDGYPMTRKGLYYEAVGYGLVSSVIGCLFAYIAIFFLLTPIGLFALRFGPPEMLMVAVFGFTIIGIVTGDLSKSVIAGFLGLLLGTIGTDPRGFPRGIFGQFELMDGLPFVVLLIGLFAISEALNLIHKKSITSEAQEISQLTFSLKRILKAMVGAFKYYKTIGISGIIGLLIGIVPAAGSTVASIVSYSQAKNYSKNSKEFGKGAPEGVISAETANNASEAGAMTTMLCFGIPGSGATAILLGAFYVHGMSPGPYLIRDNLDFAYVLILSNFIQAFLLIFVGLLLIALIGKIISIKTHVLVPLIIATSTVGAFAAREMPIDLTILFIAGLLGYVMRKYEYPLLSIVLGLVLSRTIEREFFRTVSLYEGRVLQLLERPIFLGLLVITLISVLVPLVKKFLEKRQQPAE